jgi:glycosyltransferase involved in cell wall biosynthesis
MILLSFIVPVYNSEKYIDQCINSILKINSDEYEILLVVEKSSPDNCIDICDSYARQYSEKITVYYIDEKNLSDARNLGINSAKGEYVFFLDSDDFLIADFFIDFFQYLYKYNNDIIFLSNWTKFYDNSTKSFDSINTKYQEIRPLNLYKLHICRKGLFTCAQMFVIRRSYLINNAIYFYKGIYHEDLLYFIELITSATQISIYHNPLYTHRLDRIDSLSSDKSSKGLNDKIFIIDTLLKYVDKYRARLDRESVFLVESFLSAIWTGIFIEIISFSLERNEMDSLFLSLDKRKYILKYSGKLKHIILYYLMSILNIKYCYNIFKIFLITR